MANHVRLLNASRKIARQRILRAALAIAFATGLSGIALAADPPQAEIGNGQIKAKLYLPDAQNGFYRATRFDWSGVIFSLEYAGHNYYGPWFTKYDPPVRDFTSTPEDITVGAASAITGPAEEFQRPIGYDTAKPGETFLKVGVGILRKPDDKAYSAYLPYEIVNGGKWAVQKGADFVTFTQTLADEATGYGYVYVKTVRLTPGKAEMVMQHSLKNTGKMPLKTNLYDHNFLVLDKAAPGPDFEISAPFEIKAAGNRAPNAEFGEIRGQKIAYLKPLQNQDRFSVGIAGFGADPKDYDFRIENRKLGAGMRIVGDRPLASVALWSIRSVLALEPFIDVAADPGQEFTWKYTYSYYTAPKGN